MIAIVDYGLGNIQAIANIYRRLNIPTTMASSPEALLSADRIVLPGVGSFDWAMQCLKRSGLRPTLDELVLQSGIPVLGICVGMQMMAKTSEEGVEPGLGWFDADVKRLHAADSANLMLPHMGWNDVTPATSSPLLSDLRDEARFYFLHSYYFSPRRSGDVIATADYGIPFACAVQDANRFGVQFHPEKSHGWGVRLLKNFAGI